MILADLGAEVIKVEPPGGDETRKLPGLGVVVLDHGAAARDGEMNARRADVTPSGGAGHKASAGNGTMFTASKGCGGTG